MRRAEVVDREDVQGLVARGYGRLPHASYSLYAIERPGEARALLARWADVVGTAGPAGEGTTLNVALSAAGLRALGIAESRIAGFAAPFVEGMVTEHRSRLLGDTGENDPATWSWGGPRHDPVHVLVLLFAPSPAELDERTAALDREASALRLLVRHDTDALSPHEPFGFADGISQPRVAGLGRDPGGLPAGEFVLGYRNAYGQRTWRPLVPPAADPRGLLPADPDGSGARDLGRNGTYLVVRQLEQDVDGFWDFVRTRTERDGTADPDAAERLAARMVGRWRSGAPLVLTPERDDPRRRTEDFAYGADLDGLRCPRGAHVRRVNPRDALAPVGTTREIVDRHRVLRRGRPYTVPPADGEAARRGLHFLCLGANIARQYEFVQHTWINDPHFDGLRDDADPLVAPRAERGRTFTEQARPVRRRHRGMPAFVRVRGGEYFFLPSRRALRWLGSGDGPGTGAT
ncbi:Dyp-type peroxidase [Actinomycetospora aeridis]|uniref:Peroxidase n=1 Tax=Actinomycetospora aeridis TaxID=3129231 RepID=A0ABU8NCT4_9PSEU